LNCERFISAHVMVVEPGKYLTTCCVASLLYFERSCRLWLCFLFCVAYLFEDIATRVCDRFLPQGVHGFFSLSNLIYVDSYLGSPLKQSQVSSIKAQVDASRRYQKKPSLYNCIVPLWYLS